VDKRSNILDVGAREAQQIPADDFQFDCPSRLTRHGSAMRR
jgi:hypothetical protein